MKKTARLRKAANAHGIKLCHEIHPGTAAMCADDFLMLVKICDNDPCLAVNADPSHCWEGESWESRFLKVGPYVYAAHVKNFVVRPGFPLRAMEPAWPRRGMQFTDLPSGDLNMQRYVELLLHVGYRDRYCKLHRVASAPLVVEAESAHKDLDFCSANGIRYTADHLCWPAAAGSFEEGMGPDRNPPEGGLPGLHLPPQPGRDRTAPAPAAHPRGVPGVPPAWPGRVVPFARLRSVLTPRPFPDYFRKPDYAHVRVFLSEMRRPVRGAAIHDRRTADRVPEGGLSPEVLGEGARSTGHRRRGRADLQGQRILHHGLSKRGLQVGREK